MPKANFVEFFKKYADFQLLPKQEELLEKLEGKDKKLIQGLPENPFKTKLLIADAIIQCMENGKSVVATLTESQAEEIIRQMNNFKIKGLIEARISPFKKFRLVHLTSKKSENTSES